MRTALHWFGLTTLLLPAAVVGCRAVEGGQSGDEGSSHSQPPSGLAVPATATPYCRHNVSYGPQGPSEHYLCKSLDVRYRNGEVRWTPGDPAPGPYSCDCPTGSQDVPDAATCEEAMVLGCGLNLQAPQDCFAQLDPSASVSVCWPVLGSPGDWRCQCEPDAPLMTVAQEMNCQSAVIAACSSTCPDATKDCESPFPDGG